MTDDARHLSRFPIVQLRPAWFALQDHKGEQLSYHRTKTGALRARRKWVEEQHDRV
jgi:hypothetical protein